MLSVYDTSVQSSGRQFDYWREELCHNFVELDAARPAPGDFGGRIAHFALPSVGVLRVSADAHCVRRTPAEISRSSEDCFFANLQLSGTARTRQLDADASAWAGDIVLIDTRRPFSVLHEETFDLICFKIPHALLMPQLRRGGLPPLPVVRARSGFGSVLRSYSKALLEEQEADFDGSGAILADSLVGLIAAAFNSAATDRVSRSVLGEQQAARLRAVRAYMDLHLSDPEMTLTKLVDHFQLSPRYLQKLFAATGTTFSQALLDRRLDRIAACLRRADLSGQSITQTAFDWGFSDPAYFSRCFRKRFGVSARTYRVEH